MIFTKKKAVKAVFADEKEMHLIAKPFFFEGTNGKGILLVHGWTSTAYEVRRLGIFLHKKGFTVSAPMLRGHGTSPCELEDVKWTDWLEDAEKGYEKLSKSCEKVYIGGTSIGAIIAIVLAAKIPTVAGLILMATPFRIKMERTAKLIARILFIFGKKYYKKYYPPTFGDSGLVTRVVSYQTYPVKSAFEAAKAFKAARKNISKITQPCLVMQSTLDHIVSPDSLEVIYEKIKSKVKKKRYVEKAYHTFIADLNNEHIFEDILNFLDEN